MILWHGGFTALGAEGGGCSPTSPSLASQGPEGLLGCHTSFVVNPNQSLCQQLAAGVGQWLRSQGTAGLCRAVTTLCLPAQNILGLQGIPRQFFLQVYETLRRIGETRSAPSHPIPALLPPLQLRHLGLCCFAPHLFGHPLDWFLALCPAL